MNDISSEFERITGLPPYRWQRRLVESGLPETLEIPTGCGKTEAVFMAWAYRRRGRGSIAACCASATICSRVSFPRPSGRGSIAAPGFRPKPAGSRRFPRPSGRVSIAV